MKNLNINNTFIVYCLHTTYTYCVDNSYKESSIDLETNIKSNKN